MVKSYTIHNLPQLMIGYDQIDHFEISDMFQSDALEIQQIFYDWDPTV